jgi:predicted transcriptional regulator
MRVRIVLACADPHATNTAIAHELGVSRQSVVNLLTRVTNRQAVLRIRPFAYTDPVRYSAAQGFCYVLEAVAQLKRGRGYRDL